MTDYFLKVSDVIGLSCAPRPSPFDLRSSKFIGNGMTAHIYTSSNLEERSPKCHSRKFSFLWRGLLATSAAVDVALLLGRQFESHIEAFYAKTTKGGSLNQPN